MSTSQFPNTSINDSLAVTTRGTALIAVESCIFIFLDFTALFGNSLVSLAFYRKPSLRTVTNCLVLSLALTDLSMAVLIMPFSVRASIANNWVAGEFGCKMLHFCGTSLAGISLLTVMLLAINRYLQVRSPAVYSNIFGSKRRSIIMAVSAWIVTIALFVAVFAISGMRFRPIPIQPTVCFACLPNSGGLSVLRVLRSVYIAVPSLAIVVCYVKIYRTIREYKISVRKSSLQGQNVLGVEDAKTTRMLTVVVVGFYLCWLPVFILIILKAFDAVTESAIRYWNFYFTFPMFTSSVINPVIYATMSQPFRKEFLKILQRRH